LTSAGGNDIFVAKYSCSATSIFSVTACDSYTVPSGDETYTSSQTVMDTIPNTAGCDSVMTIMITINKSSTGTDTQSACNSYTWIDGITYTSSNNTAIYTLSNSAGCDSVVTLNLTINAVSDVTTTTSGVTITANNSNATYQWLDCDNGYAPISGATEQSFTATTNGNYAVELTENACVDTSDCVSITSVGIIENSFGKELTFYPNPTNGELIIDFGQEYKGVIIIIYDINGKQVDYFDFNTTQQAVLDLKGKSGVYFIDITGEGKRARLRIIKR